MHMMVSDTVFLDDDAHHIRDVMNYVTSNTKILISTTAAGCTSVRVNTNRLIIYIEMICDEVIYLRGVNYDVTT